MDNQDILLDLSTERTRKVIKIDGKQYELAAPQDFQIQEYLWLSKKGEKIAELGPESHDAAKLTELTKLLDELIRKIVYTRMPRRVLRELDNGQKIAIVNAFTRAVGIKEATPRPRARPTPQDGTNLSPASSASMVDQLEAGSKPASGS